MEKKYRVSTTIPKVFYDYLNTLGKKWYNLNRKFIIQNSYDYCVNLPKEELEEKLAQVASKYYKLFLYKRETSLIHIDTTEPMKQYQANNLLVLYTLIYLADNEQIFDITEENRFNV